ncbi:MAG: C-terminal binding protein [Atribacterota bacterium]|nr:C-terminal binding protein [Atribacterota bacterium]
MIETKKNWNIFITDSESKSVDIEIDRAKEINAIVNRGNCTSEKEVIESGRLADALLVDLAPITEMVINSLENCKVIVRYGIGLDNVDVAAATRKGIPVVNFPTFCIHEVSTHAVAMTLSLIRKLLQYTQDVKSGLWDFQRQLPITDLRNCKIGVLGFGNIGQLYIEKTKAFGVEHLVCDPYVKKDIIERAGVKPVSFAELLTNSDVISIHTSLNKETKHLFGEEEFKKMKNTALIINTARGGIIDEEALYRALKEGWIAGAALDSLEEEPPLKSNPLFRLSNVILTPHVAFYSETSLKNLHLWAIEAVINVYKNKKPEHLVNSEIWGKN